jgi:hypothetical protein
MNAQIEFSATTCGDCGINFMMPSSLFNECKSRGRAKSFFCPNGHERVFTEGTEEKLRREKEELRKEIQEKNLEVVMKNTEIMGLKRQIAAAKKRKAKR